MAGGLAGLVFGCLLFVGGTLLVSYTWAVVDTKFAVVAAARQAARTYVEAPNPQAALGGASAAARQSMAGFGRRPSQTGVSLIGGSFGRCARITIRVAYPAPLFEVPFLGTLGRGQVVTADHSELVDPYRSGLPGTANCA